MDIRKPCTTRREAIVLDVQAGHDLEVDPGFQIEVDEQAAILKVRGWGVWTVAIAESYREEMIRAFSRLRHRPWSILVDRGGQFAQSEEVAEIVRDVMARATAAGRVRAALIINSPTTLLQWRRLIQGKRHIEQRTFPDEAHALAWLTSEAAKAPRKAR